MTNAAEWLAQWPIWALVALLTTAVFYARWLTQRVGGLEQGQADLKAGLASLTTRMEALFGELRTELADLRTDLRAELADMRTDLRADMREGRAEVSKAKDGVADVRERVAVLEATGES